MKLKDAGRGLCQYIYFHCYIVQYNSESKYTGKAPSLHLTNKVGMKLKDAGRGLCQYIYFHCYIVLTSFAVIVFNTFLMFFFLFLV